MNFNKNFHTLFDNGHPFVDPLLHFDPQICLWQQPDYRPLNFSTETRFASKDHCSLGIYSHIEKKAVVEAKKLNMEIMQYLCSLEFDKVYVLCENDQQRMQFIKQYKNHTEFIGKFKVVLTTSSPQCFADTFLQGQQYILLQ